MQAAPRKNKGITRNIIFRCYADLNDFLPAENRQQAFVHSMKTPVTVREAIESLGIPLSEVELVLVNGDPATRGRRLCGNDRVTLYPGFVNLDVGKCIDGPSPNIMDPRFVLDAHLGKLAKYLRMLGFDTLYRNDFEDEEIIGIAASENRILLTRDKELLRSGHLRCGYYIRAVNKHEQLREVVRKFGLSDLFKSFTRCMTCNSELVPLPKEDARVEIPEDIFRVFDEFYACPSCRKIFWKGSHFARMESFIRSLA